MAVMAVLIAAIIWLGAYPQPVFNIAASGLANLQTATRGGPMLTDGASR
jgi:NADH:ubiquinone oxidoreductase subunit 4 (subunit M)